jgi:histone acetyltransferase (RNA polymerase elongator complex component)
MKKHAIIPIFIPHRGCPHDCVFCNQRKITARTEYVTPRDARDIIDTWLTTLRPAVPSEGTVLHEENTVEAAFYGGSFTGLEIEEQSAFLEVTYEYKQKGLIDKVHLSTRPDYIDREILDNLRKYSVDTIELGVQSFDDEVLRKSNRGHSREDVYRACELIREYGFELGIQLMIGLPGDTAETCIMSAEETARLRPSLARLYPTIVLDDTELFEMYRRGEYEPLSREEAVQRTKEMYKILDDAGITIMRVGLKSTEIIGEGGAINGGTYHPAFRQLVEGEIAKERIEPLLREICNKYDAAGADSKPDVTVFSNKLWFSNMIGHKACNRKYFGEMFPDAVIRYSTDESLGNGCFAVSETDETGATGS